MPNTRAEILINQQVIQDHYRMVLKLDGNDKPVRPGQFFLIKANSDYDPLLRRPLSVHRISSRPNIIEFLYRVTGKGTQIMSRRSKGTSIDLLGPLGTGFRVPRSQSNFILVAGGIGVAPLVALSDELAKFRKRSITVILGAKTRSLLTCEQEFKEVGARVIVATEDGSQGDKALASEVLEDLIKEFDLRKSTSPFTSKDTSLITIGDYRPEVGLYACGPVGMIRSIAQIARHHRIQIQASLEERMACGIGACLGCAIKTRSGYKTVCKDGPVFDLEDIVWE